jgi:hypothetical protein
MPFRHAHWYVLSLFPLAALAFWPNYLSQISTAPPAFHAHGITATLWLLLLTAQSWTIHHDGRAVHRRVGLASLLLFPLFLAGGAGIFIGMAQRYVEAATPFYQMYPARLAWFDVIGVGGVAYFFYQALKWRRKVHVHSGYMLATALFLVPPIIGRLSPLLPGLAINGPADFGKLMIGFQLGNGVTALIALVIGLRSRHGQPFFIASALHVLGGILFQTVGGWPAWQAFYRHAADIPVAPFGFAAGLMGIAIAWAGWSAGRRAPARGALAT